MSKITVVKIDARKPDEAAILQAVVALQKGALIVSPTETRYGLITRADREESLKKVGRVKKRPADVPIALFVRNLEAISDFGRMTHTAQALAEAFLPGPLTLVLTAVNNGKPPVVVNGKIGVRFSSSPVIKELISQVDFPLTATSANVSGQPELELVDDIVASLGGEVELYLDAGRLDNPTSTVVDCTGQKPRLIREGFILKKFIDDVLNKAGLV